MNPLDLDNNHEVYHEIQFTYHNGDTCTYRCAEYEKPEKESYWKFEAGAGDTLKVRIYKSAIRSVAVLTDVRDKQIRNRNSYQF